jgi:hypothetical protein
MKGEIHVHPSNKHSDDQPNRAAWRENNKQESQAHAEDARNCVAVATTTVPPIDFSKFRHTTKCTPTQNVFCQGDAVCLQLWSLGHSSAQSWCGGEGTAQVLSNSVLVDVESAKTTCPWTLPYQGLRTRGENRVRSFLERQNTLPV